MFNNYIFVFYWSNTAMYFCPYSIKVEKKVASCLDEICRIYITGREFNLK